MRNAKKLRKRCSFIIFLLLLGSCLTLLIRPMASDVEKDTPRSDQSGEWLLRKTWITGHLYSYFWLLIIAFMAAVEKDSKEERHTSASKPEKDALNSLKSLTYKFINDICPEVSLNKDPRMNVDKPLNSKKNAPWMYEPLRRVGHFMKYNVFSVLERVATFRALAANPSNRFPSVLPLAEAGFIYTGVGTTVECEGCKKQVDVKEFISPAVDGRYHGEGCRFVVDANETSHDNFATVDANQISLPVHNQILTSVNQDGQVGVLLSSSSPRTLYTVMGFPSHPAYVPYRMRLESYPNPFNHVHTGEDLAAAGFFYAGYSDCVRCFHCGLGLRSWKPGDNIDEEHHKKRPDCMFLLMKMRASGIDQLGFQSHQQRQAPALERMADNIANHETSTVRRPANKDKKEMETYREANRKASWPERNVMGSPSHPAYVSYRKRLNSYPNLFDHVHTREALAAAGFFYAGYSDCVRCFHCGLGLISWKPGDNIDEEHHRNGPDCMFLLMKMRAAGIDQLGLQSHQQRQAPALGRQVEQEMEANKAVHLDKMETPSHPAYVPYWKRLKSYPDTFNHIHTRQALADAGFFYAGYSDCVRCFHCGLGLRSWKPGDNIYEEHHKNRPDCMFLLMKMRTAGIDQIGSQSHQQRQAPALAQQATHNKTVLQDGNQSAGSVIDNTTSTAVSVLEREQQYLKQLLVCKVCHKNPVKCLFLPCGELLTCLECSKLLTHCPSCNARILFTAKTYII